MDKLVVGKVTKIHGIKGAVKIVPIVDDNVNFADLGGVFIDNDSIFHEFEEVFAVSDVLGVKFADVNSASEASAIVGKFVYANKETLESLVEDGSFYIEEMKGCKVLLSSGEEVGELTEIDNFGSADIFYIKSQKYKNLCLPHIEGLVLEFSEKAKTIKLSEDKFKEVAVYDD